MRASLFTLLLALGTVPALALSACGGSTSDDPIIRTDTGGGADTGGATTDSSASETTADTTVGETATESGTDVAADGDGETPVVCSTLTPRAACTNCCGDENPAGEKEFVTAVTACACGTTVCKTECATTACAAPAKKPDATCQACIQASIKPAGDGGTAGACVGPVSSACTGACKKYLACLQSCSKG